MGERRLGVPLVPKSPEPIKRENDKSPGFGWRLSDTARRQIDEIDRHILRFFPPWFP